MIASAPPSLLTMMAKRAGRAQRNQPQMSQKCSAASTPAPEENQCVRDVLNAEGFSQIHAQHNNSPISHAIYES